MNRRLTRLRSPTIFATMIASASDETWMGMALEEAREAARAGDVPVGAALVRGEELVALSGNRMVRDRDPLAHAEMLVLTRGVYALRDETQGGVARLSDCTLYVTLEPCAMCAGAIVLARVSRVVFGAWDDRAGMAGSVEDLLRHPSLNHRPQVLGGVQASASAELLRSFFQERRGLVDTTSDAG